MTAFIDGPASPLFKPLNLSIEGKPEPDVNGFREAAVNAPVGDCVAWGIPFAIKGCRFIADSPVTFSFTPEEARWFIFAHTADLPPDVKNEHGFPTSLRGQRGLAETVACYHVIFDDGEESSIDIRLRLQIGAYQFRWGESCFEAVSFTKPNPIPAHQEQMQERWGISQLRAVYNGDYHPWVTWLWAWENPRPGYAIKAVRIEPVSGATALSGITSGQVQEHPLRWRRRQKAIFTLPESSVFDPMLDERGRLSQIQLDLGQVISARPRRIYPNDEWSNTPDNALPEVSEREILVEYAAHPDARFHLYDGTTIAASELAQKATAPLRPVSAATQRVNLRVVLAGTNSPVPVKLHVHGESGEYLVPVNRHRIINPGFFEDYSVDYTHKCVHDCTYIPGETLIDFPIGRVYIEVTKGFEIKPIRRVYDVTPETTDITIELEKVLDWRERGWVTADTHVHFLSPGSALLEGAGEGVNIVNLLASQWGELMTNVGDFDSQNVLGASQQTGDGEYIVRVGTENRQRMLGHISLLGYNGCPIAPMTTGGPEESAIGDPVEALLTEWARQCQAQQGIVVIPHFSWPRGEHAAAIVQDVVDAIEMTSWGDRYSGINPYSLVDWYRYLNCGYLVAAVGGTDKMSASTAVGTVRTYALIDPGVPFSFDAWKDAVRRARTFASYGPLLEFTVDGHLPGDRISMGSSGGTVDVEWRVASLLLPMTRVELIVNGEVRESTSVRPDQDSGHWSVRVDSSSWLALLVRGAYPDKQEMIGAHSSPVMVDVEGTEFFAAADAVSILDQIEGSLAYLDTLGTRAETNVYKRMRLELTSAHRSLHNKLHERGFMHQHTPTTHHPEHDR